MDNATFGRYMGIAQSLGEYGRGYQRGLRRHYHGEAFGTAEEHTRWLAADVGRQDRADLARGYRDGVAGREPVLSTPLADLLTWEATYRVWLQRARHGEHPASRELWAEAPLHVRVRQAERWLSNALREAKRQATMAARRGR